MLVMSLLAAVASHFFSPRERMVDAVGVPELDALVPRGFGSWQLDVTQSHYVVNPTQREVINRIYDRILERVYVGIDGYRIMLSIAYGADQRSGMALSVHYPEVCYPAQGFEVVSNTRDTIATSYGALPIRRLVTSLGGRRIEPVSYWVLLGERLTVGGVERRLIELEYGFSGKIPDGLLFRVSSIDQDTSRAFAMQDKFLKELLSSVSSEARARLIGGG